jgi:predicted transcriptional regulator
MSETILGLTARIVVAHVGNNTVRADQLPSLIRCIYQTLSTVGEAPAEPTKAEPVVEVKRSVFADHLVCLACGKSFKTLKWHIMSDHQLTPDAYRAKFGLTREYPMIASAYSKVRSAMSKKAGLGHWRVQKKGRRKRG